MRACVCVWRARRGGGGGMVNGLRGVMAMWCGAPPTLRQTAACFDQGSNALLLPPHSSFFVSPAGSLL